MYTYESKVGYSELNRLGFVRPEVIVNYLQDCTTFHSDSLGANGEYYRKTNKAWILNAWQIDIKEQLKLEDELVIGTWPYEFVGAYGNRNCVIMNREGKNLVEANAVWVLADMTSGRPVRPTDEDIKFFTVKEKLNMNYADRKIKIPKEAVGVVHEKMAVRKSFIDTNDHVNNARYIECAAEYLPEDVKIRRIRVEYRRQARLGDAFYPMVYDMRNGASEGIYAISLNDENGKPYALAEFDIFM